MICECNICKKTKPVKSFVFSSSYKVTACGKVYSLKRKTIKKTQVDINGYEYVSLYSEGKQKRTTVHRLVAQSFFGKSEKTVNHINGIKTDNRLDNLEFITMLENIYHAMENGLRKTGANHGMAKLNNKKVLKIRSYNKDVKHSTIAKMFNVTPELVSKIRRRILWKHI